MAMTDPEIQKLLESLNTLLKGATSLSKNKPLRSDERAEQQKQTASQKSGKDAKRLYEATANRARELGDTIFGLNKSLGTLNSSVGETGISFGTLSTHMTKFMASLTPIEIPEASKDEKPLGTLMQQLITEVQDHKKETIAGVGQAIQIGNLANSYLKVIAGATVVGAAADVTSMPTLNQQGERLVSGIDKGIKKGLDPAIQGIKKHQIPFQMVLGRMIDQFAAGTTMLGSLMIAAGGTRDVLLKLTGDFFLLSKVGMGSVDSLYTLSKNALFAGMSLKEYQETVNKSITVAARSGTLENFERIISAADSQLASMGVFGAEARQMQASLAESSTLMGVRQGDLTDAISGQIKVFDRLRRTTNMTAEEFAGLVKDLSRNEQAQRELIGLAPAQRYARRQEILQIATVGQRMGMAAEASKTLAEALIAQRGDTVKSRIDQAGRIRQLGQLTGMGAAGDRAAMLGMKHNKTAAETEEFAQLAAQIDQAARAAYERGSLGIQNALDFFNESLVDSTSFGKIMKASRPGTLAQDSGRVNQEAFGKHVGEFGQAVQTISTWLAGFDRSVGPALGLAVGGALLAFFKGPILKVISMAAGRYGIPTKLGAAGAATEIAASGTALKGVAEGTKGIAEGSRGIVANWKATSSLIGPGLATLSTGISGAQAMLNGLKVITKGITAFGGVFAALQETITGEITEALNPNGGFGARVGGIITAAFTALPNFIFGALEFVFGESFIARTRNAFDTIVSFMNMAIKDFLAKMIGGVGGLLKKILPSDSKLVKLLDNTTESLKDSAAENAAAVEKLWNDNTLTLAKLSTSNTAAAKNAQESTAKATAAQAKFNNVQYGTMMSQASVLGDARALIGSPQVQIPNTVKPTAINTGDEQTKPVGTKPTEAAQVQSNADLLAALNNILAVMRETLTQEQRQSELAELLLRSNRPQATFTPSDVMANKLLKGYA